MIRLWTINRLLRWTGFRLVVSVDLDLGGPDRQPTELGLRWYGFYGSPGWRAVESAAEQG